MVPPPASVSLKTPNPLSPNSVRQVDDLGAKPQVWLVRAEPVHALLPRETREGTGHIYPAQLLRHGDQDALDRVEDVVAVPERPFQVQLGELELTVSSEVLVPVAAGDLEIPLDPGDHQQLLEELGGLGQGVELSLAQP